MYIKFIKLVYISMSPHPVECHFCINGKICEVTDYMQMAPIWKFYKFQNKSNITENDDYFFKDILLPVMYTVSTFNPESAELICKNIANKGFFHPS